MATDINGVLLSEDGFATIRLLQNPEDFQDFTEVLDTMIDVLIVDGSVPDQLSDHKFCLDSIRSLRYLTKLLSTLKKPIENGE